MCLPGMAVWTIFQWRLSEPVHQQKNMHYKSHSTSQTITQCQSHCYAVDFEIGKFWWSRARSSRRGTSKKIIYDGSCRLLVRPVILPIPCKETEYFLDRNFNVSLDGFLFIFQQCSILLRCPVMTFATSPFYNRRWGASKKDTTAWIYSISRIRLKYFGCVPWTKIDTFQNST